MKVPIIKGKKVTLRPLSLKDAPLFIEWMSDPEITIFLNRYNQPPSLKEERKWILDSKKDKERVSFSIVDNESGDLIGNCVLFKIRLRESAEFGIMIGNKRYWGQGYGPEVTKILINYGFKTLKLHRVYLRCFAYNIRGFKAYEKVGFKKEGVLREHRLRNGAYHDEILMGMLKDEFIKKNKLK